MQSSAVFFGPGLSRDKDLGFTFEGEIDLYAVAYEIAKWPLLLRPLASKLLPRARALKQNYQEMIHFLEPVLKKQLQTSSSGQEEKPSGRPSDFMQWMLDASQTGPCTLQRQCQLLLDIATDASFATSLSLTHISFDLATYPEYI